MIPIAKQKWLLNAMLIDYPLMAVPAAMLAAHYGLSAFWFLVLIIGYVIAAMFRNIQIEKLEKHQRVFYENIRVSLWATPEEYKKWKENHKDTVNRVVKLYRRAMFENVCKEECLKAQKHGRELIKTVRFFGFQVEDNL